MKRVATYWDDPLHRVVVPHPTHADMRAIKYVEECTLAELVEAYVILETSKSENLRMPNCCSASLRRMQSISIELRMRAVEARIKELEKSPAQPRPRTGV